jgi:hypothetical protein
VGLLVLEGEEGWPYRAGEGRHSFPSAGLWVRKGPSRSEMRRLSSEKFRQSRLRGPCSFYCNTLTQGEQREKLGAQERLNTNFTWLCVGPGLRTYPMIPNSLHSKQLFLLKKKIPVPMANILNVPIF